ncbi:MAG: DUF4139 domain-containing protein, partial [Candidatus Rokuibacteriota bacterium]
LTLILSLAVGGAAWSRPDPGAQAVTAQDQRDLALTIYNGNLGLVKDVREVRLGSGSRQVQFMDVAALIDPTSVHLKSLTDPKGLKILEQNYEYDLLSSQKLMEKYVGRKVRLYQGNGSYLEATLLSTNGPIYDINGQIYMGHHGNIVLPSLPENLVSKPTLVWLLRNQMAAPQRIEASYLTGGITWKADYVMILNAADDRADLSGWVTIDNKSGSTYKDAALKLVAGDVHRAADRDRLGRAMEMAAKGSDVQAPRAFASEGFFEYHLYTLDGRTTVKDNQTKQLSLMAADGVPVAKQLIYYGARDYYRTSYGQPISNQKVSVFLEIANSQANNLGLPLPKGKVRVYKADKSGSQQFIGEDWIDHTPKDERVKIKMGEAFDVVGERVQKDWKKIGWGLYEVEWEISLRNHKKEDVTVTVFEPMPGDWEVLRETHRHEKVEAHTLRYQIPVPKEGAAKLTYRVRVRF